MPTQGQEKGIRTPYHVRFGITNPSYTGVNTQKAPMSLPDTEGPKAINVRIVGGRPISRGGQEKSNFGTLEPIHGFFDTTGEWPRASTGITRLSNLAINPVYVIAVLPGSPTNTIMFYRMLATGDAVLHPMSFDSWAFWIQWVRYGAGYYVVFRNESPGDSICELHDFTTGALIATLPTGYTISGQVVAYGTDIYFPMAASGVTGRVDRWDGSVFVSEHAEYGGDADKGVTLGLLGGVLYMAHYFNPGLIGKNVLRKRTGVATFSDLAIPGVTYFEPRAWAEYSGRLYWIGGDDIGSSTLDIISTDGGSVTLDHQVTGTGEATACLFVQSGKLYYLTWDTTTMKIGQYDGATWTDNVKDLTADLDYPANGPDGFSTGANGFQIFVSDGVGNALLYGAPTALDVTGTWVAIASFDGTQFDGGYLSTAVPTARWLGRLIPYL